MIALCKYASFPRATPATDSGWDRAADLLLAWRTDTWIKTLVLLAFWQPAQWSHVARGDEASHWPLDGPQVSIVPSSKWNRQTTRLPQESSQDGPDDRLYGKGNRPISFRYSRVLLLGTWIFLERSVSESYYGVKANPPSGVKYTWACGELFAIKSGGKSPRSSVMRAR